MNKNMLSFAVVGAAVGLVLAHFYPDLGLRGGDKFAAHVGRALGDDEPYFRNAAVGAAIGVIVSLFAKK